MAEVGVFRLRWASEYHWGLGRCQAFSPSKDRPVLRVPTWSHVKCRGLIYKQGLFCSEANTFIHSFSVECLDVSGSIQGGGLSAVDRVHFRNPKVEDSGKKRKNALQLCDSCCFVLFVSNLNSMDFRITCVFAQRGA